ncbi:MAG: Twin-arginine translocation protein TatC [Ktedonobacterales bacterium]|nr:MAG: Twin-arginine translocation protein TatC [Ktedonobacterales bacterium]
MARNDVYDGVQLGQQGNLANIPPTPGDEGEGEGATMTLVEHLEELRKRLFFSVLAIAIFSILGFVFWDKILEFLASPLPDIAAKLSDSGHQKLISTDLGGPFLVALKVAVAVGIVVGSPIILYQVWAFISPALTRKERKYALPFTVLGVGLFITGLALGYVVLRYPVQWLFHFGSDQFILLPDANSYLTFVAYFLLAFGIVFELPLVLTFMGIVGIINSRMLRQKRMYILFGLWVLSCFITPGADPYSPIIIGVSLTFLFELSVLLLRIIKK